MKTIEETYRERLVMLSKQHGGQTGLSKLIDKSPAQISQWINGSADSKTGKARSMKSDTAREIEIALNLPRGWMDQPINAELSQPHEGYIQLKLLDIKAAAGDGAINAEYPESVQMVEVSEKWVRKNIGNNFKDISIITASGDSMQPTFNCGDWLFVDQAVKFYEDDGVYVFMSGAGLRVKRLQKLINGELKVISDNQKYKSETLVCNELNSIKICGKVVATLRIENI